MNLGYSKIDAMKCDKTLLSSIKRNWGRQKQTKRNYTRLIAIKVESMQLNTINSLSAIKRD